MLSSTLTARNYSVWIVGGPRSGKTTTGMGLQDIGGVHISGGEMYHALLLALGVDKVSKEQASAEVLHEMFLEARTHKARLITFDGLLAKDWAAFTAGAGQVSAVIRLNCSYDTMISRWHERWPQTGEDRWWGEDRTRKWYHRSKNENQRLEASCKRDGVPIFEVSTEQPPDEVVKEVRMRLNQMRMQLVWATDIRAELTREVWRQRFYNRLVLTSLPEGTDYEPACGPQDEVSREWALSMSEQGVSSRAGGRRSRSRQPK
jgi:adenylate kinase family enzyme